MGLMGIQLKIALKNEIPAEFEFSDDTTVTAKEKEESTNDMISEESDEQNDIQGSQHVDNAKQTQTKPVATEASNNAKA